jgi:hypothetical protein
MAITDSARELFERDALLPIVGSDGEIWFNGGKRII